MSGRRLTTIKKNTVLRKKDLMTGDLMTETLSGPLLLPARYVIYWLISRVRTERTGRRPKEGSAAASLARAYPSFLRNAAPITRASPRATISRHCLHRHRHRRRRKKGSVPSTAAAGIRWTKAATVLTR